jgi:hypothetical protein
VVHVTYYTFSPLEMWVRAKKESKGKSSSIPRNRLQIPRYLSIAHGWVVRATTFSSRNAGVCQLCRGAREITFISMVIVALKGSSP